MNYYWEATNVVTGEVLQSSKEHTSLTTAVQDAKYLLRTSYKEYGSDYLLIKVFDKSPDERAELTYEPEYSDSFQIKTKTPLDRLSPKTYGDWVDLAMSIKERVKTDDFETMLSVNRHLNYIHEEEWYPEAAQESKRWLTTKAGELGVT